MDKTPCPWYYYFMISEKEKQIILDLARKYHAARIFLFGSALSDVNESREIDIAVEGIEEKDFFSFYGELLCSLTKPVDVVDLSMKTKFIELILKEGISLYA